MAYNTKAIKLDVNQKPIPQIYNPVADEYEVLQGENGAARHIIYGTDGQPISTTGNKLAVRASEVETILNEIKSKDFATQTTLAAILAKIIAAPATEAKQDTLIGHVDGVKSALASILAKLIDAPATEAKQDALAALIGEVDADPTANTLLARIKSLEDKIDAIIDGSAPAVTQLSGSNVPDGEAIPTKETINSVTGLGIKHYSVKRPSPANPKVTITTPGVAGTVFAKDSVSGRLYEFDTRLRYSNDDGASFNTLWNPGAANGLVHGTDYLNIGAAHRLSNGRFLASLTMPDGAPSDIYISDDNADDTSKTFTKVLDMQFGVLSQYYGFYQTENLVFLSEYGPTIADANARFAYMSTDYGSTWTQIFEGPSVNGAHIHHVSYDEYNNIVIIVTGDGVNANLYYSRDFGDTWEQLYEEGYSGTRYQFTGIKALPHCILLGSDCAPIGMYVLDKEFVNGDVVLKAENLRLAYLADNGTGVSVLFHTGLEIDGAIYFASQGTVINQRPGIVATRDGVNWYEIYKHPTKINNTPPVGFRSFFTDGSSLMGRFCNNDGTTRIFEMPLPTWIDY